MNDSVSLRSRCGRALLLGALLAAPTLNAQQPASAASPVRVSGAGGSLSEGVFDPLRAQPSVLDRGTLLPGDTAAVDCARTAALPSHPLSLGEAVDLALCNSPQLQGTWADIKLQAAQLGEARATWLPTLTSSLTAQKTRTSYPDFPSSDSTQNGHTVYADVTWRLFDFGARSANDAAATRLLDAALAAHDAALQKTLGTVVQAYFDAITARAAAQGRKYAAGYAFDALEATKRREQKGAAPVSDVLQADAAYAKARLAAQRAAGEFHKSLSVLLYSCGFPPDSDLVLADEPEPAAPQAIADLGAWLETTMSQHPSIRAARAKLDAAEAKVSAIRAQGLPSVDFSANYYRNGYPNQGLQSTRSSTTTVGVTLNIPLFEGFARTYQVNEARAQVEQADAQLRDTGLQLKMAIVKDHEDAMAAIANLDAAMALVRASDAALRSARNRYEQGEGDVLELLTAETGLADASQERIRCIADWRSARLRLFADAGTLNRAEVVGDPVRP